MLRQVAQQQHLVITFLVAPKNLLHTIQRCPGKEGHFWYPRNSQMRIFSFYDAAAVPKTGYFSK
jgi:hypothetical protein